MKTLGYLGPLGTYSHEIALKYTQQHQQEFELIPFSSISDVIYAVDQQQIAQGIIPMENSIEGYFSCCSLGRSDNNRRCL